MAFNAGDIEAKLTLRREDFQAGLDRAKQEVKDFQDERHEIDLEVKADTERAKEELDRLRDEQRGRDIRIGVRVDQKTSGSDDTEAQLKRIEAAAKQVGDRSSASLMPLLLTLGAMPTAALAAGAAFTLLPVAFGAAAGALLKDNEQVKNAFANTWGNVKTQLQYDAAPIGATYVRIAQEMQFAFHDAGDQILLMFQGANPALLLFSHGVESLVTNLLPGIQSTIGASLPTIAGMNSLLAQTGTGISALLINMSSGSVQAGQGLATLGSMLQQLLGSTGTLLAQLEGGWASIGPQFAAMFNTLLRDVTAFTGSAVPAFASGLRQMMDAVSPLLSVLGPIAPLLGSIGGQMGVWVTAARLLDGPLASAGAKLSTLAVKLGDGADKGGRFASVLGSVGGGVVKVAGALPLIGAGVSALQGAWQSAFGTQDQFVQGLQSGGAAADQARQKLAGNDVMVNQIRDSMGGFAADLVSKFIPTSKDVGQAYDEWFNKLGQVGQAQALASQAQNQYNYMVGTYGPTSKQAQGALNDYRIALGDVETAQNDETHALQDSNQQMTTEINNLLGLVGANLNYQDSLLTLKTDQDSVTTAVKGHGAASVAAQQAENAYQQQLLAVVQAAGKKAAAENASKTKTEQNTAATQAEIGQIIGLAAAAGDHAPPALRRLVDGLTNAQTSAYIATGKVAGTRQEVLRLHGKDVRVNVNGTGQAVANAHAVANAISQIHDTSAYINTYVNTIVRGPSAAAGGMGGLLGIGGHADGGDMAANLPTMVGERGPELLFPSRSHFVATATQTQNIFNQLSNPTRGQSGLSTRQMADAIASGISAGLSRSTFRMDGDGVARLVNNTNLRNRSR